MKPKALRGSDLVAVHCWLACGCGGYYQKRADSTVGLVRCHHHRSDQRVVGVGLTADGPHHNDENAPPVR